MIRSLNLLEFGQSKFLALIKSNSKEEHNLSFQIIIHGGANERVAETNERNRYCKEIINTVARDLRGGANALDTCEKAVVLLEDTPIFNAGTGSYIQVDGKIRMDAAIMTSKLELGCVLQISDVKNPISVARKILEDPLHTTLSGDGANQFSREIGYSRHELKTDEKTRIYKKILTSLDNDISYKNTSATKSSLGQSLGTVGCVVRDNSGLIVTGTSTGGLSVCYPGRVGDAGQPGNGTYANQYAGISCTGIGEKIMQIGMARIIALYVELDIPLEEACNRALTKLGEIGGLGGVIAISNKGEVAYKYNSKTLSMASASE